MESSLNLHLLCSGMRKSFKCLFKNVKVPSFSCTTIKIFIPQSNVPTTLHLPFLRTPSKILGYKRSPLLCFLGPGSNIKLPVWKLEQ